MHCLRDASSIHHFLHACPSHEVVRLVEAHLAALSVFDDVPLNELVHFFILEPEDSAPSLEGALDRNIADTLIETCLSHAEWFELIIIVSDDGFGHVVYIPKNIADQSLLEFCAYQSNSTKEDDA